MDWFIVLAFFLGVGMGAALMRLYLDTRRHKVVQQACNHPELKVDSFNWVHDFDLGIQRAVLTCTCQNCGEPIRETTAVAKTSKDKDNTLAVKRYSDALKAKGWLYSEESDTWLR